MSSNEQVLSLLSQVAFSFDGAVLGLTLACCALRSVLKYTSTSSALRKLCTAPFVSVSDLRSILNDDNSETPSNEGKLVIVRGTVEAKSAIEGNWKSLRPNVLVSQESGERAVVIQRTQTCIYNEWKGFLGYNSDLRAIFAKSRRRGESTSLRTVPFILVEAGHRPHSDSLLVNLDGSKHPLPLDTVYHRLQPVNASPYTFLQALFGHEFPVGLLDEEKILPLGKDITAVGVCNFKNGIPEIKSCGDLPYFLIDMTRDQMVEYLAFNSKMCLIGGVIIGSISLGILGYAAVRNWNKWKAWKRQRRSRQESSAATNERSEIHREEEIEVVPEGELCVICLMRRRRSAFVPCGHRVCCQYCAISIVREGPPRCPVCRQDIGSALRIYDS